jgi:hypothetical protein
VLVKSRLVGNSSVVEVLDVVGAAVDVLDEVLDVVGAAVEVLDEVLDVVGAAVEVLDEVLDVVGAAVELDEVVGAAVDVLDEVLDVVGATVELDDDDDDVELLEVVVVGGLATASTRSVTQSSTRPCRVAELPIGAAQSFPDLFSSL